MIILGKIQQVVTSVMTDKQTGAKSNMNQVIITDATKPGVYRMTTPFCLFLGEDKLKEKLGSGDLTDEPVTLIVKECAPYNALLKVKGDVFKGHQGAEALAKMQAATPEQSPAPKTK